MVAREVLDAAAPEVMGRLVDMAREGDRVALRLVVERLLPRAGREVRDELRSLARAGDLAAGLAEVIRLAAVGEISLEEAREFGRLLELERRAIETQELAVRLEALERLGEEAA